MVLVSRSASTSSGYETGGNMNKSTGSCVMVAVRLMILIQLMDTISCFTYYENQSPLNMRQQYSRIHSNRPQQQQHPHVMTPSHYGWGIVPPMTQSISTLSTAATAAASFDDTNSNKKKRMFRLPTINIFETNRINRRTESTFKDHTYWVKHRRSDRLLHHIRTMPKSIIYQTIRRPVRYITYISSFVVLWNCLVLLAKATTARFDMSNQVAFLFTVLSKKLLLLRIPMDPLVMTSPMLGLLLGTSFHSFRYFVYYWIP
jgi:hypothetical protein